MRDILLFADHCITEMLQQDTPSKGELLGMRQKDLLKIVLAILFYSFDPFFWISWKCISFNYRYILPVIFLSIVLNIPKFLEPKLQWQEINSTIHDDLNQTFQSDDNFTQELTIEPEYEIGKWKNPKIHYPS